MLALEEARSIQAKRQKSAVTKFLIHLVIVLILNGIADALFVRSKPIAVSSRFWLSCPSSISAGYSSAAKCTISSARRNIRALS